MTRLTLALVMFGSAAILGSCGGNDNNNVQPIDAPIPMANLTVTTGGSGTGTVTSPNGIACGSECNALLPIGTSVTMTPNPGADSTFTGWTGGDCTGTGPCTLVLATDTAVTATFLMNNSVTVTLSGTGSGKVISNPGGVDCGNQCAHVFSAGATTLTAAPVDASTIFTGWSVTPAGAGAANCSAANSTTCTVTIDNAPVSVQANFAKVTRTLTVINSGGGLGSVISSPAGINCGTTCTHKFDIGTTVTLYAVPDVDQNFQGWMGGGAGCSGVGTCVVTLNASTNPVTTVTAIFKPNRYFLGLNVAGEGTGTITANPASNSNLYAPGTKVTLTAPNQPRGVTFNGWSVACDPNTANVIPCPSCSGTGQCSVTMNQSIFVTATFACSGSQSFGFIAPTPTTPTPLQTFTVPLCATSVTITAAGAQGGGLNSTGGLGVIAKNTFTNIIGGESLDVLVGGMGGSVGISGCLGGGGGGSFVVLPGVAPVPLLIAGGGGGAFTCSFIKNGADGSTSTSGTQGACASAGASSSGTGGDGAFAFGGGGGFYTGAYAGGSSYVAPGNGAGAGGGFPPNQNGGFGGGGQGWTGFLPSCGSGCPIYGGGGGGGYSGGASLGNAVAKYGGCSGGGGGSFGVATSLGGNTGDGSVIFAWP